MDYQPICSHWTLLWYRKPCFSPDLLSQRQEGFGCNDCRLFRGTGNFLQHYKFSFDANFCSCNYKGLNMALDYRMFYHFETISGITLSSEVDTSTWREWDRCVLINSWAKINKLDFYKKNTPIWQNLH